MRFLFLIHGDRAGKAALTADERRAIVAEHISYGTMLRERDAYVLGEAQSRLRATFTNAGPRRRDAARAICARTRAGRRTPSASFPLWR
jgi:hypothetical protein